LSVLSAFTKAQMDTRLTELMREVEELRARVNVLIEIEILNSTSSRDVVPVAASAQSPQPRSPYKLITACTGCGNAPSRKVQTGDETKYVCAKCDKRE
jgi:hypothetical protein